MARVSVNSIAHGLSGRLGGVVFRQVRGKTIMSNTPSEIKKQSVLQRENRSRFKNASAWAKWQTQDPERKAYYARKAKKLKLPNAYTAAISDYMRKGEIKEIDTRLYKGKAGDVIRLKVSKKDFSVHKVEVTLYDAEGAEIECGMAIKKQDDIFFYKAAETVIEKMPARICVMICDHYLNRVMKEARMGLR
jgi:hypothetical protein